MNTLTIQSGLLQSAEPEKTLRLHFSFYSSHFLLTFLNICIMNLIVSSHIYIIAFKLINYPIWTIAVSWAGKDCSAIFFVFLHHILYLLFWTCTSWIELLQSIFCIIVYEYINYPIWTIAVGWTGKDSAPTFFVLFITFFTYFFEHLHHEFNCFNPYLYLIFWTCASWI